MNDLQTGEILLLMRIRGGLSQSELADYACVSRNSVSLMERGQYNPTLDWLEKVAYALGVTMEISFVQKKDVVP